MLKQLLPIFLLSTLSFKSFAQDSEPYAWTHALTLESISNLDGGIKTGTRNLTNLDLTLSINTQAADWWDNGTVFIYVLGNYGKPPSELTGELQTLSNIEAENNIKIYELWYQHSFADGAIKVLMGLHDYNSTFYSLESSGLFNESAFGIGPDTSQVTPSIFPTTATTLHLTLTHDEQYFLLAIYDGVPGDPNHPRGTRIKFGAHDGVLTAAEWGFAKERDYKIGLGGWQQTTKVENPIDGSLIDSNNGFYVIGEKYFTENLAVFFQYGHADASKNQLENYFGMGATYKNFLVEEAIIGLGYARSKNSEAFIKANPGLLSAESVVELSYFIPLIESVAMQTSLYSVKNPSMQPDLDNSLALGVRFYIDF